MALTRPSEKILKRLQAEELSIRREIAKAKVFSDGIKSKFWEAIEGTLKPQLEQTAKDITAELNGLHSGNDRNLIRLIERHTQLDGFLKMKDFVKAEKKFKEKLEKKMDEVKEYREKLDRY